MSTKVEFQKQLSQQQSSSPAGNTIREFRSNKQGWITLKLNYGVWA
jgi:hypothetical protein